MNEQQMEALEKMFPRGFVITVIAPNNSAVHFMNNPEEFQLLERLYAEAVSSTEDQKRSE